MIDYGFIGKDGLIIQYEDLITMIGFNVIRYLKAKGLESLAGVSLEDTLVQYNNREEEDPSEWLQKKFQIDFHVENYLDSVNTFQPILLYSYKVFHAAEQEGIQSLFIHSNQYSSVIKEFLQTYQNTNIKYTSGDIIPMLESHPNCTLLTSSTDTIQKCLSINMPMALTICDDYGYIKSIFENKIDEALKRKPNLFVRFTSVLSGGFINI
jgi:hypothetical protein